MKMRLFLWAAVLSLGRGKCNGDQLHYVPFGLRT